MWMHGISCSSEPDSGFPSPVLGASKATMWSGGLCNQSAIWKIILINKRSARYASHVTSYCQQKSSSRGRPHEDGYDRAISCFAKLLSWGSMVAPAINVFRVWRQKHSVWNYCLNKGRITALLQKKPALRVHSHFLWIYRRAVFSIQNG